MLTCRVPDTLDGRIHHIALLLSDNRNVTVNRSTLIRLLLLTGIEDIEQKLTEIEIDDQDE